MKKVNVTTVDTRRFVQDLLALGAIGGVMDESCIAYKGILLRAEVLVPDDAVVETSERVKISADYIAKATVAQETQLVKEVDTSEDKEWTREELESLTIKQVKEITGLSGRDKGKMIDEYFANKESSEEATEDVDVSQE